MRAFTKFLSTKLEPYCFRTLLVTGVLLLATFLLSGCQDDSTPKSERLTILTINLRGAMDVPDYTASGNWKVRYARVGNDLKAMGTTPDLIALQEVNGW